MSRETQETQKSSSEIMPLGVSRKKDGDIDMQGQEMNKSMTGKEIKMIELKSKIAKLKKKK